MSIFTPKSVTKKLRLQLLASCLLLTLFSSTVYYLTLPDTTNANTTYTWTTASDFTSGTTTNTAVNTFEDSVTLALKGSPVTDTTKEEFLLGGSPLNELYATAIDEQDDGEVVLNQGWRYGLSSSSFSIQSNKVRYSWFDDNSNLIYVSNGGEYDLTNIGGVSVIDTKGTRLPSDDETLITYNESSNPAISAENSQSSFYKHSFLDPDTDFLYIVKMWSGPADVGGLNVIDTKGTKSVLDDTFVTSYNRSLSTARLSNDEDLVGCGLDSDTKIIYCAGNDSTRYVSLIDTKGNKDPNDDVSYQYSSLGITETTNGINTLISPVPKLTSLNIAGQTDLHYDDNLGVVYVGTYGDGLVAIDTNKTATTTDDRAYLYKNDGIYETTSSSTGTLISGISLPSNVISGVSVSGKYTFIGFYNAGLVVVDNKDTPNPADDTIIATYSTDTSPPLLSNNTAYHSNLYGNLLYVSTYNGVSVIDTKGTDSASDDVLVRVYNTRTSPSIGEDYVYHSSIADDLLYVSTWGGGLSVINLNEEYSPEGSYASTFSSTSTTPTSMLSFDKEETANHSVSLQYRTGDSGAVWRNDFDDDLTTEYAGDFYAWGSQFNTVVESEGTMKLSDPAPFTDGLDEYLYFWIDTGEVDDYFPIGSKVTARVRVNSDTRVQETWDDFMFSDDWWDDNVLDFINNEWQTVSFIANSKAFSKIGFEVDWRTGTWSPTDTFEIDWIQIELPESEGHWNPWSTPCTNPYSCPIDPADLVGNDWLQYKLNLSTTDRTTTPSVHSVTFSDGYESSGTYTSSETVFTKSRNLLTFNADTVTPAGTDIDFSYSLDRGNTWQPINPGDTFPKGANLAKYFKWKATLTTNSATTTPVINSVSIDTTAHQNTITTSVATQAERLEAQGKQEEADTLKDKRGGGSNGRPSDREIKQELVTILEKTVSIIKRIKEIEAGE